MTPQDASNLLAEALEVDIAILEPGKAIAEFQEWNSLAWLTIISLLDERHGIHLSGAEIRGLKTIDDFIENVTAKVASV